MERITAKVKKWGNSLGVILPKGVVNSEKIKEGLEVNMTIQPKNGMTVGDVLVIHNCGGHGYPMGHNYNGRVRPTQNI